MGLTPVSHEMTRRRMSPPQPRDAPRPLIGKPRRSSTFSLSRPSSHRMTSPPSSRTLRPAVRVLDCFEQPLRPGVSEGAAHDDVDRRDDLPVILLVPIVGRLDHRALEADAAVETFGAAVIDEVGVWLWRGSGAHGDRPGGK